MFDTISYDELRRLATVESPICISIYLPTHRAGPGIAEDPLRLKNLIVKVRGELEERGMRSSEATDLLGPVDSIVKDAEFWAHSGAGLALFVSSDEFQTVRLPGPVDEAMLVADRLWIAPLLPFVAADDSFYLLALSKNKVRLLRGSRYQMNELGRGGIPISQAEALRFDDRESQLQSHGAKRIGSGEVSATFHGQGVGSDFDDIDRARFLHAVDRGLGEIVGDGSRLLVLAGAEEIVAQFRKESSHPNIVESFIRGNVERMSPLDLHKKALPLVASRLAADQMRAREFFGSPSRATVDSLADAVDAATSGRIGQLFVASGQRVWGSIDPESRTVEEHLDRQPGDGDLIDLVARETLGHGGDVFAVDSTEMPTDGPLAAVLRY